MWSGEVGVLTKIYTGCSMAPGPCISQGLIDKKGFPMPFPSLFSGVLIVNNHKTDAPLPDYLIAALRRYHDEISSGEKSCRWFAVAHDFRQTDTGVASESLGGEASMDGTVMSEAVIQLLRQHALKTLRPY